MVRFFYSDTNIASGSLKYDYLRQFPTIPALRKCQQNIYCAINCVLWALWTDVAHTYTLPIGEGGCGLGVEFNQWI